MTSVMRVLEQSVIVFSQSDLPLYQVNIKQAIVLLVTNKAESLYFSSQARWEVYSPRSKQTWNHRRA